MTDRYTIEQFRDWVSTQDENEKYVYVDNESCAFALFLKSLGHENCEVYPFEYTVDKTKIGSRVKLDTRIDAAVHSSWNLRQVTNQSHLPQQDSWTFGHLLKRLDYIIEASKEADVRVFY